MKLQTKRILDMLKKQIKEQAEALPAKEKEQLLDRLNDWTYDYWERTATENDNALISDGK